MPKENKHSRGKRGDKGKRKREEAEDGETSTKRQKPIDTEMEDAPAIVPAHELVERPFFGMLEDQEQEYFRHADEMLEANEFEDDEQRQLFLKQVYHEAEGKELKIANSQSCSRLMERLILLSTPTQKKSLFEKFRGNFLHLVQHRFASHCCETLFVQSAPIVTAELTGDETEDNAEDDSNLSSMEDQFLLTLDELEGYMTSLLTDRFASHTLRVLLVVLSGKPLEGMTKSLLSSKKKEKITVHGKKQEQETAKADRVVPESFTFAMDKIISDTVTSMDSSFIRVLATHPTGNPTLQLLLELELTKLGKQKVKDENSVIRKLLPDDLSEPDSESVSFINGLVYDSMGSRLLQTIVTYAPGKLFKQMWKACFKERIGQLARNETASFVVITVLERLNLEDLNHAVESIIPQLPGLIERSKTSVIKTVLERCAVRGADTRELAQTLKTCYGSDPISVIPKMVDIDFSGEEPSIKSTTNEKGTKNFTQLHGSLLAQTMLRAPGPLSELIQSSLLSQSPEILQLMSQNVSTSHIIQVALEPTKENVPFRRKITAKLLPLIPVLATHPIGAHVVDSLWNGTEGIMNLKERIAGILVENEGVLRESNDGRKVWRNWWMDLFKVKKREWLVKAKESAGKKEGGEFKGRIEAARDRYFQEKERGGMRPEMRL